MGPRAYGQCHVDATVAQELKSDGLLALIASLALILAYVAIRFDLFFAPGAVIALLHDPLGAPAVYVIGWIVGS